MGTDAFPVRRAEARRYVRFMTEPAAIEGPGYARYTFRLRVSSAALDALLGEWGRCRWIWNECAAHSKKASQAGEECGPARLDKMLTEARGREEWLRKGSSVPQQQVVRDFAKSRAKAVKDVKAGLPVRQRAGLPRFKRKGLAAPTLHYTRRGFRLADGRLHLAGGIVVTVVWSRELPACPSSVRVYRDCLGHWHASFVVRVHTEPLALTGAVIGVEAAEVPLPVRHGPQGGRCRRLGDQARTDQHGAQTRPGTPPRAPGAHDHGLRAVRSESQARTAAVGTYLHLHRMRSGLSPGQEFRIRDARPGRSRPGWR